MAVADAKIFIEQWTAAAGFTAKFWLILQLAAGAAQAAKGAISKCVQSTSNAIKNCLQSCLTWNQVQAAGTAVATIEMQDIGVAGFSEASAGPSTSGQGVCEAV